MKNKKYDKNKAFVLLKKATELNNKAKNLKEYQNAVLYFLKKCKNIGLIYSCK